MSRETRKAKSIIYYTVEIYYVKQWARLLYSVADLCPEEIESRKSARKLKQLFNALETNYKLISFRKKPCELI